MINFWDTKFFCAIDTETTGTNPDEARVVEVGISVWHGGKQVEKWGQLVNPGVPIPAGASDVHQITDAMVAGSPSFSEILSTCLQFMSLGVLVTYNAPFDVVIMQREFERVGAAFPVVPVIDPLVWFRKFEKWNKGKKLTDAAKRYGFQHLTAHRAYEDADMAMQVLFHMYKTRPQMPKDLQALLRMQRSIAEDWWVDINNYNKKIGRKPFDRPQFEVYEAGMR